jgi:hypothetical protein
MSCTLLSFDVSPTVWTAAGGGVAWVVTAEVTAEAGADVARVFTAETAAEVALEAVTETGTVYDTSFDGRLSAALL